MPRALPILMILLALAACAERPQIAWPEGPQPATPALLPATDLVPPPASPDPGPAQQARALDLRARAGL